MIIENPCVVSLTWTLSDAQNQVIDVLSQPTEFLVGGHDLLPSIENTLLGQTVGYETQIQLEPDQAFGEYNAQWVCFEARDLFPPEIEVGMQLEGLPEGAQTPDMPADALYTITDIYPSHVVLDGNHPLAGMALRIALKVMDIRRCTEDESNNGTLGKPWLQVLQTPTNEPDPNHDTLH